MLIAFETAKLAKEKGFNEPVSHYYFENGELSQKYMQDYFDGCLDFVIEDFYDKYNYSNLTVNYKKVFSAPTQSQLQKWLRKKHNIHISIYRADNNLYGFMMEDFQLSLKGTYEEALEMGLQTALRGME